MPIRARPSFTPSCAHSRNRVGVGDSCVARSMRASSIACLGAAVVRLTRSQQRHPATQLLREGIGILPACTPADPLLHGGGLRPTWDSCLTFAAAYAKGASVKGKGQKGAKAGSEAGAKAGPAAAEDIDLGRFEKVMAQALQHFKAALTNIRSGRANPGLIEPIMVESDNDRTQLRNLGTVIQRNPQLLVINVFDEKDVNAVVQAIRASALELQARVEGKEVHVPVPKPSVEVLQRMAKLVHQEAEAAKTSVRGGRHQGLDAVKRALKDLPDDRFRMEAEVQKLCDRYIAEIEKTKQLKDKDLKDNH